ncbi:MAG: haloacid dehalogenase-like hydrolase [Trichococcus flocculiformis]|uniref:Haloacid dehalogenase-like hydrolase n=1 Tax=Trichococcus flocculiformis TaxID=82803 RepID=A0A847D5H7_9LACT|nr:HAD family hydrolase [Trichococcus flocculiformis]NLD31825.1 haloacid dehalogenase-like hydrolase [Trichococcus flocculiformis]
MPEKHNKILSSKNWAPHTHQALNAVISSYGNQSSSFDPAAPPYVVFDFDNTSAIMDIEDTLMLYMLLHLDYRLTPDQFHAILTDGLENVGATVDTLLDKTNPLATIGNIADDIKVAYAWLYKQYEGFMQGGTLSLEEAKKSSYYEEFAAKIRLFYTVINGDFKRKAGYPWMTYLFAQRSIKELRQLAYQSISYWLQYGKFERVTLTSPADLTSKAGVIVSHYDTGLAFPNELKELYHVLQANGIVVYVISASPVDVVQVAATHPDFGYGLDNEHVIGMYYNKDENGLIQPSMQPGKNITKGPGKTAVITEQLMPKHNEKQPLMLFGDSTGDYDMMMELKDTKLCVLFNRYMNDDTQKMAREAFRTIEDENPRIVLQGRDENKGSLRPSEKTILLGTQEEVLIHEA